MPARFFGLADAEMKQSIEELATEYYAAEVRVDFTQVKGDAQAPPSLHEERVQQETDRQKSCVKMPPNIRWLNRPSKFLGAGLMRSSRLIKVLFDK